MHTRNRHTRQLVVNILVLSSEIMYFLKLFYNVLEYSHGIRNILDVLYNLRSIVSRNHRRIKLVL